jgi:hypothetical protein
MVNELSRYDKEEAERFKKIIDNFNDYRQVEIIYDYCFEVLNNADYWEQDNKEV